MTPRFLLSNAAFVVASIAVAAWAAWPIYESWQFLLLVVVATILGSAIAFFGRRYSWLVVAGLTLGVYLVVGLPLAVPSSLSSPASGWLDLVVGSAFGWKQLVTVSIPVGAYQALLVPALLVFLPGATIAFSVAWRARRAWFVTALAGVAMQAFGLIFGRDSVSDAVHLPFEVDAPREALIGITGFLVAVAFLLWRVRDARRVAIRIAQDRAGIVQSREPLGSVVRRFCLAGFVIVLAVVVGALATPAVGAAGQRDVLRAAIDPETLKQAALSPLTDYRTYFTPTEFASDLFTVKTTGITDARVRLAVLSYYDGQVYRAIDPATDGQGSTTSAFERIPYRQHVDEPGTSGTVTITIDNYRGLWLPTVGQLEQASFGGDNGSALADGFFYNTTTGSAIETRALQKGDSYELDAVEPTSASLASLTKPSSPTLLSRSLIPKSLTEWVNQQGQSADAAGLAELVRRLRARGYLSHSLDQPADGTDSWVTALGSGFQPSLSGHSMDRIGTMFTALLDKQAQAPTADDSSLIAAVGDDEQFAVATALIAQDLGFPARVVLGFSLGATNDDTEAIPACTDGVCTGQNLTAWTEVQGAQGWVPVTTTPQHTQPFNPVLTSINPPKNPTVVDPEQATEQDPPVANPSGGDADNRNQTDSGPDLTWLVTTLKVVGVSLLAIVVVLSPFASILFAKARRRRGRRRTTDAENRIVGGWDEYVDSALDHGFAPPSAETRLEAAAEFGTPQGAVLARLADRAVFGPVPPIDADGEQFWAIVDDERLRFDAGLSRWQRIRAALSVRSLLGQMRTRVRR